MDRSCQGGKLVPREGGPPGPRPAGVSGLCLSALPLSYPVISRAGKKHKEQDGCWRPGRLSIVERQARGKARLAAHPTEVSPWLDHAIRGGQINEFDQVQINTFFHRPSVWNRPIQIHLRPATYRRYCQVWQQLVCFAYRSTRPGQAIRLRYQLNTAQIAALDRMEECGRQLQALALD